jgi:serine/threonine protein kinase
VLRPELEDPRLTDDEGRTSSVLVDWECCLGAGGEGEVYLARRIETSELCAVKVSTSTDPEVARDQLRGELERCRRARGEGAVGLIGWNLEADRPFLVFELASAGSLADEIGAVRQAGRVYHPARALERVREILRAVAHVHAHGLVHRDVKPANLLRFGHGLKLTDFGTGRTIQRPRSRHTEAFVGTRHYAAPEQRRGEVVDERADLYAVGCILHEMITGQVPEAGQGRRRLAYPSVLVIPELDALLASLLDEDPARRPVDAQDALGRLDAVDKRYRAAREVWQRLGLGPSPY